MWTLWIRRLKADVYDVFPESLNYKSPKAHIDALKRSRKKNVGIVAMKTQAGGYEQGARESINPDQSALNGLDGEFVDCAIPGMVNRQQLAENSGVIGMKMGGVIGRHFQFIMMESKTVIA